MLTGRGGQKDGDQLLPDILRTRFSPLTQYVIFKTTSIASLRRLHCSCHVQESQIFPMMRHFVGQKHRAVRASCQAVHLFRSAGAARLDAWHCRHDISAGCLPGLASIRGAGGKVTFHIYCPYMKPFCQVGGRL